MLTIIVTGFLQHVRQWKYGLRVLLFLLILVMIAIHTVYNMLLVKHIMQAFMFIFLNI